MKKTVFVLAATVLLLTVLCLGSYVVVLAAGGSNLGGLGGPIRQFAYFPNLVQEVVGGQEVRNIPLSLIPTDDGYDPESQDVNRLDEDLYGLMAFYAEGEGLWRVVLENYRTGALLKEWKLPRNLYVLNTGRQYMASRPKHSILLPNDDLLVNFTRSKNLMRIDAQSNPVWVNRDMLYHHSMNLDAEGNVWTCGTPYLDDRPDPLLNFDYENADGSVYSFRDDHIVCLDTETGETLRDISIAALLAAHGEFGRLVGHRNNDDPIHLNDVQPILEDGPYWKRGDLLLSMKHLSTVMHYRPATDEIIKFIEGPLIHQHDAAVYSDHEVSVFNNNYSESGNPTASGKPGVRLASSEILVYDYRSDSTRVVFKEVMNKNGLHTPTAGLHYALAGGKMLIDLDDFGRLVVLDSTGIIFSKTYPAKRAEYKHLTSWPRIYETLPN